jgi:hypothetical protein
MVSFVILTYFNKSFEVILMYFNRSFEKKKNLLEKLFVK